MVYSAALVRREIHHFALWFPMLRFYVYGHRRFRLAEGHFFILHIHQHLITRVELTRKQADRQRALDVFLQRAAQRAGAKIRVIADVGQPVARFRRSISTIRPCSCEAQLHFLHLQVNNVQHLLVGQRREDDDLVDAVEEFGPEGGFERFLDLIVHLRGLPRCRWAARSPGCRPCARIRCPGCWS